MNETKTNGSVKQLRRTRNGRVIAGVCSGIGEYIGVDPNILRVALAVATLFGGMGVGIYAVAWLLIPEEDRDDSIVQDLINKNKDGQVWQDAKAKWDSAQQTWWKPSQPPAGTGPVQAQTGYENHPYAASPPTLGRPHQDGSTGANSSEQPPTSQI
jgi:phage shock protein PspC (stress-responsive transcriptional regulator)